MNNKIVLTKKSSTIFLAIVLVVGTIAAIFPSFMIYAQAEVPDFVMDMIESEYSSNNNDYENEYIADEKEYTNSYDDERNNGQYGKTYYNEESYSHDDDSYDDGMYSKYPTTKDKKFVCKTGQFEGFFVKSPEFCDLVIPEGPQGKQGPPGITQINSSNFYTIFGNLITIPEGGDFALSRASCDAGDTAISGSYSLNANPDSPNLIRQFKQDSIDTWATSIDGTPGTSLQTRVHCFDNPPLRP